MASSIANLLLRVISQKGDATNDVEELAVALEALDHTKAEAEATVDVDQSELEGFAAALEAVDHKKVTAKAEVETDFKQLQLFSQALDKVRSRTFKGSLFGGGKAGEFTDLLADVPQQLSFDVDVDTTAAKAQIEALQGEQISFDLETEAAQAEAVGFIARLKALFAKQTIPVDADVGDAERELAGLKLTADQLTEVRRIDIQTNEAKIELERLKAKLAELSQQDASPEVDLKTEQVKAQITAIEARLVALGQRKVEIKVDIDRNNLAQTSRAVNRMTDAFGGLASAGAGVGQAAAGMAAGLGKVTVNLGMFGARLGPLVALILTLAITIGVSLVGALAAVAASAALAATALAALGVALAGAFLPILAVGIPAILALAKILQVLQQEQNEAETATQRKAQADQQAALFAQQHADAERELTQAIQATSAAKVQAYREMQDAIERVTDAQRSLQQASLSKEQASLNVEKAKNALKEFRKEAGMAGKEFDAAFRSFDDVSFDPKNLNKALAKIKPPSLGEGDETELKQKILDLKQARLSEKEAIDNVSDSERELTRAREDALKFQKDGIRASDQYTAALRRQQEANRNLARLEQQRDFQKQNEELLKSKSMIDDLSKSERKLLNRIKEVKTALGLAFGPAVNAMLDGIAKGIGKIVAPIKELKGSFKGLGATLGGAFAGFMEFLAQPEMVNLFKKLIKGANQLVGPITSVFGTLLKFLLKIAVAAMPFLVDGMRSFAGSLKGLDAIKVKDIRKFIGGIMPFLKDWIDLAKKLGPAFFDLIVAIAPFAHDLLVWVGDMAKKLGDWAKSDKGREEIKRFFKNAIPTTIAFIKALIWLAKAMIWIVNAVGWVGRAIKNTWGWLKGAGKDIGEFFSGVKSALDDAGDFIKEKVDAIGGFFEDLWNLPAEAGRKIADGISNIDWGGLAQDIWDGLVNGLESAAQAAFDSLVKPFVDWWNKITNFFGVGSPSTKFFDLGVDLIQGLINGVRSLITGLPGRFFTWGARIIKGLGRGIASAAEWAWGRIKKGFGDAKDWVLSLPTKLFNWGVKVVTGLGAGIKSVAGVAWDQIKSGFAAARDWVLGLPARMFNWGLSIITGLANGIASLAGSAWDTIKNGFGDFKSWITGVPGDLFDWGVNIVTGFIDGLRNKASDLFNTVKDTITKPFKDVAGFFGFGSPAKLMIDWGKDISRGLEVGLSRSSRRLSDTAMGHLGAPVAAGAAAAASGMTIGTQNINLPAAPGHDQMGDPRHQAAQFALEMRKRARR